MPNALRKGPLAAPGAPEGAWQGLGLPPDLLPPELAAREQQREARSRRALEQLAAGDGDLGALLRGLCEALGLSCAFVGRVAGRGLELVAACSEGPLDLTSYRLTGSLCEAALLELQVCPAGARQRFPDDGLLAALGAESALAVPLQGSEAGAVLVALHSAPLEEDLTLLFQAFARRVEAALGFAEGRSRLESALTAHVALRPAQSAAEVYRLAVAAVLEHSQASTSLVCLVHQGEMEVVAAAGHLADRALGRRLPRGHGLTWRVFEEARSFYTADAAHDEPRAIFLGGEIKRSAYLGVPITDPDGRPFGVLSADTARAGGRLTAADRYYLEALAQAVSAAVARLAVLDSLRRESERFKSLANLSARLELLHDPVDIARTALEAMLPLTGFTHGTLWTLEGETLVPELMVGEAGQSPLYRPRSLRAQPGLLAQAMRERRTLWIADYAAYAGALPDYRDRGLVSVLATPLFEGGEVCGVVALDAFATRVEVAADAASLLEAVSLRLERALQRARIRQELESTREDALRAMGLALEFRDYETKGHTQRVTELSLRLGRTLGLGEEALTHLRWGSYLHDAGKMAIADSILLKPGRLEPTEWEVMKGHVIIGERLVSQLGFIPAEVLEVVRHHHERWDGAGYPDGRAGAAVPLLARIFAVADVYDALVSERPYKRAWSHGEALAEIVGQAGKQFDAEVTAAFARLWEG